MGATEKQKALFEKSEAFTWILSKSLDILSNVKPVPPLMFQSEHQNLIEAARKRSQRRQLRFIKGSDSYVQITKEIWLNGIQIENDGDDLALRVLEVFGGQVSVNGVVVNAD